MVDLMEKKIYYYLDEIAEAKKGHFINPISCEIDLSNRCMLNCNYCMYKDYRKKKYVDLDMFIYKNLLSELKMFQVKSITFTGGGEPLMNPRFNEMVALALELKFEVGLITNGVLLSVVDNIDRFTFIRVSLDAGTPETYHKIKKVNNFDLVIDNVESAIEKNAAVGLSYVVCKENADELEKIRQLLFTRKIKVKYIQFKPAYQNGNTFKFDFEKKKGYGNNAIVTKRFKAKDNLPCLIAGLVGIVGADANVYFCCQHRGNEKFKLGSLKEESFEFLWEKRFSIMPDISSCPQCRYMNYAKTYVDLMKEKNLFFEHRYFL